MIKQNLKQISNNQLYQDMYISSRSGIQCRQHPNQQYANYCTSLNCLKPLCPDCVQIHTKLHDRQEIESWKNCLSKQKSMVSSTLSTLKKIQDQQRKFMPFKSLDQVVEDNVKILHMVKEKAHKIIEQFFANYQQHLTSLIKKNYRVDMPDTTKLRMAILELAKLTQKLDGSGKIVLDGLKLSHQLDHQNLLKFFEELKYKQRKPVNQTFVIENHELYSRLRQCLQSSLTLNKQNENSLTGSKHQTLTPYNKKNQSYSVDQVNPFEPLKITMENYFSSQSNIKHLHFFIPSSNELKILPVEAAQRRDFNWKSIQFTGKHELPCYFKSITTPEGSIYLTGGSQNQSRSNEISQYNYDKNSLDLVAKMKYQRSSHSICSAAGLIYMIGGFSNVENDVTRSCQVFDPKERKCYEISPLIAPSANSCAVPFNNEYIFKIGGVQNKTQGNNLIEMYSIKKNKWIVVKIEYDKKEQELQLLSFSAGVQINHNEILVFGGYDNSEYEQPKRTCFSLIVNPQKGTVRVKNHSATPLPFAEGFWNNNPIIHNGKVYALQNINDPQDQLTAIADQKRVLIFNGDLWISS